MKILLPFIFLCLLNCSSSKNVSDNKKNNLPVDLIVHANKGAELIKAITKKKIEEKNMKVLNNEEAKDMMDNLFKEVFRNSGIKSLQDFDTNRLNDAFRTTKTDVNFLHLYCVIKETDNQTLFFDSLSYNQRRYIMPSKDTKRINFDLQNFKDRSITIVLDSLVNYLYK